MPLQAFALKINNDAGSPAVGTASQFGSTGHYPNLLDASAMEKFVDLTHAEYARRLGSLTDQIDVFYTNEPHLGTTWHAGGARPAQTSGGLLMAAAPEMETALHAAGQPSNAADLAQQFLRAKPADVEEILKTLATLGRARKQGEKFTL